WRSSGNATEKAFQVVRFGARNRDGMIGRRAASLQDLNRTAGTHRDRCQYLLEVDAGNKPAATARHEDAARRQEIDRQFVERKVTLECLVDRVPRTCHSRRVKNHGAELLSGRGELFERVECRSNVILGL